MDSRIYRHSVWIDVFGVLLAGTVLLGGLAYLLYHTNGAVRTLAVESNRRGEAPTATRHAQGTRAPSRPGLGGASAFSSEPEPLLGDRSVPTGPTGTAAPFSDRWQDQAAPDLSGPSSAGGSPPGGRPSARAAGGTSSGPATASSRPSGGPDGHLSKSLGSRSVQPGERDGGSSYDGSSYDGSSYDGSSYDGSSYDGSSWRGEARTLAGRAQALSSQLRQLEQESSAGEATKKSSKTSSGKASTASASSNDRDVPNPPSVPIDDHLHWLVMAGLLWGIWRLGVGT